MTSTAHTSFRIDIPAHDGQLDAPTAPPPNLTPSPTKSPEEIAIALSERAAKTRKLHELHLESIAARAKRANERVKEGVARKLRLEAARVEKAAQAIERSKSHAEARKEEDSAKREAAKARRDALLESVRQTREARSIERRARQLALAEHEERAAAKRSKRLLATVDKGRAHVKHALAVAEHTKEKRREETEMASLRLQAKLECAEQRRRDMIDAASHASVDSHARLARLANDEASELEARRLRLAACMGRALGRRAARLDQIAAKARAANLRAADVATDTKAHRDLVRPCAVRRAIVTRLQVAEVNRLTAQKDKLETIAAVAAGVPVGPTKRSLPPSPQASPPASPGDNVPGDSTGDITQTGAPDGKIRWLGPNGGAGRVPSRESARPTAAALPNQKRAVAFFIPARELCTRPSYAPPVHLSCRLLFHPKLALATTKARHAAASGRRRTILALRVAKAAHYGTMRVAQVQARLARHSELMASVLHVREERGAQKAEEHLRSVVAKARLANHRVLAAAMRRSAQRLELLNDAMIADARRQHATVRRAKRLLILKANRYGVAASVAARARLASRAAERATRGALALQRCTEASARRAAILDYRIAKARALGNLMTLRRVRPSTRGGATAQNEEQAKHDELARRIEAQNADVDAGNAGRLAAAHFFSTHKTTIVNTDAGPVLQIDCASKTLTEPIQEATTQTGGATDTAKASGASDGVKVVRFHDDKPILGGGRVTCDAPAPDAPSVDTLAEARSAIMSGGDVFESVTSKINSHGGVRRALDEIGEIKQSVATRLAAARASSERRATAAKDGAWARFAAAVAAAEAEAALKVRAAAQEIAAGKWRALATARINVDAEARAAAKWGALADAACASAAAATLAAANTVASARAMTASSQGAVATMIIQRMKSAAKLHAAEERAAAALRDAKAALAAAMNAQADAASLHAPEAPDVSLDAMAEAVPSAVEVNGLSAEAMAELIVIGRAMQVCNGGGRAVEKVDAATGDDVADTTPAAQEGNDDAPSTLATITPEPSVPTNVEDDEWQLVPSSDAA